jgi:hypothetical protein
VAAPTQDDLRQLLAPLDLHKCLLKACLESERSGRFIPQRNAPHLDLPTHSGWDEAEKPYLSVICRNTTIITIHRDPLHTLEDHVSGLDEEVPLYAQSCSALLHYVLIDIVAMLMPHLMSVPRQRNWISSAIKVLLTLTPGEFPLCAGGLIITLPFMMTTLTVLVYCRRWNRKRSALAGSRRFIMSCCSYPNWPDS